MWVAHAFEWYFFQIASSPFFYTTLTLSGKFTVQEFFYKQFTKGGLIYKKLQRGFVFYVGVVIGTGGKLEPPVTMASKGGTASHSGGTGERGEGVPPLLLAG